MPTYFTLDDFEVLLSEKGYLGNEFKTGDKVAYWLRELRERFDECQYNAIGNSCTERFIIEAKGYFNSQLDRVNFMFKFDYDPDKGQLSLNTLQAQLGSSRKAYVITEERPLPAVADVYSFLSKRATYNKTYNRFFRMENEIKRKGQSF